MTLTLRHCCARHGFLPSGYVHWSCVRFGDVSMGRFSTFQHSCVTMEEQSDKKASNSVREAGGAPHRAKKEIQSLEEAADPGPSLLVMVWWSSHIQQPMAQRVLIHFQEIDSQLIAISNANLWGVAGAIGTSASGSARAMSGEVVIHVAGGWTRWNWSCCNFQNWGNTGRSGRLPGRLLHMLHEFDGRPQPPEQCQGRQQKVRPRRRSKNFKDRPPWWLLPCTFLPSSWCGWQEILLAVRCLRYKLLCCIF